MCCVAPLLLLSSVLFISPALCYSEEEARLKVQRAEDEVLNCYEAVFEAEKAGANITVLLNTLNEAVWFLSEAKLAYSYGDYDSAFNNATECLYRLEDFVNQADSLRFEAERAGYMDFMVNFVGSAFGSVGVAVSGYAVWIFLKKREKAIEV
jgi:hypothetical protein